MKKHKSILVLVLLMALSLAACNNAEKAKDDKSATKTEAKSEDKKDDKKEEKSEEKKDDKAEAPKGEAGEIESAGLGIISMTAKSKEADGEKEPFVQGDTTVAAVAFDKDGKIVKALIDVAQTKLQYKDGKVETTDDAKSKKDLKFDYKMKDASPIKKEWFEQIASFEEWLVGKTIDDLKNLKTYEKDPAHKECPDDEDLKTSVTIDIGNYRKAVIEAYEKKQDAKGGAKLGMGMKTDTKKSKAKDDKGYSAQINTTASCVVMDKDGKVVRPIIDTVQNKVAFTPEGKFAEGVNTKEETKTKLDLGDAYNMRKASKIKKEWFEQIASFQEWMIGKDKAAITGLPVEKRDDAHPAIPTDPDLTSSVTISVENYQAVVAEAME